MSFDRLKIDQSFVQNINVNRSDEVIIQALISMAKNLKLDILAEGVETEKQLDFLKSQNCMGIQGYYFSKPLPADELAKVLKNPSQYFKTAGASAGTGARKRFLKFSTTCFVQIYAQYAKIVVLSMNVLYKFMRIIHFSLI